MRWPNVDTEQMFHDSLKQLQCQPTTAMENIVCCSWLRQNIAGKVVVSQTKNEIGHGCCQRRRVDKHKKVDIGSNQTAEKAQQGLSQQQPLEAGEPVITHSFCGFVGGGH